MTEASDPFARAAGRVIFLGGGITLVSLLALAEQRGIKVIFAERSELPAPGAAPVLIEKTTLAEGQPAQPRQNWRRQNAHYQQKLLVHARTVRR